MVNTPIEWVDAALDSKERKILTSEQLKIPGLQMFGQHNATHAISALNLHYHKDCFEMVYIVQGNVRFSVNNKLYPLSGGDLFVTFPNEIHDTGSFPMSLHQMYWFQLNVNAPDGLLFMAEPAAQFLRDHLYNLTSRVIKMDADEAAPILSSVFQYFRSGTQIGIVQGAQLLGYFLLRMLEQSESTAFRITPDIGRAMDYIMEHIEDPLTMEELAQEALLSVSRFKQKFKAEIGSSPRSFINFHKVELAKRLLLEGRSVTDVAMELNFSSSNYFSSVFRRYTYFSPSQYLLSMETSGQLSSESENRPHEEKADDT